MSSVSLRFICELQQVGVHAPVGAVEPLAVPLVPLLNGDGELLEAVVALHVLGLLGFCGLVHVHECYSIVFLLGTQLFRSDLSVK